MINTVSAISQCAICGAQFQNHALQQHPFEPMPSPTAWFENTFARTLMADMRMLTALSDRLALTYADDAAMSGEEGVIGSLEAVIRFGKVPRVTADGLVGTMLNRLETMRDEYREDLENKACARHGWLRESDEADDYAMTIDDHIATVTAALEAK